MIISYKDNTSGMHWDNVQGANILGEASSSTFDNYVNSSNVCFRFSIIIFCIYFIIQYSQTNSWPPFALKAGSTSRSSRTLSRMLLREAAGHSQPCTRLLRTHWIRQLIWMGLTRCWAHLMRTILRCLAVAPK